VVTLSSPEEQDFSGKMLKEGLAWFFVWLMTPELGIGSFLVWVSCLANIAGVAARASLHVRRFRRGCGSDSAV
jgi:hypothetical protein